MTAPAASSTLSVCPASPERMAWLRRFRRAVAEQRGRLCGLIECDTGKPAPDALVQDVIPLLSACRWLERRAPALLGPRRPGWGGLWTLGQRHRVHRVPLGTVAIIATWNYPVQLLGVQLAHALVAGNRVIVKPSENSPRAQHCLLQIARHAGLSEAEMTWTEPTREAGPRLLREHAIDHLVFTGSTGVGRAVAQWAAESLTPTTLELSGCDTALVLDDADPELAARSIWFAATANAGQTCMAPRRALVMRAVYGQFLEALAPRAASAKPLSMVSDEAAAKTWKVALASLDGARSLSGVLEPPEGRRFTPLALVDCAPDAPAVRGEHFGPLLAVVPVDSIDQALCIHRACPQHLSASVYTRRPRRHRHLAALLRAGIVTFNDSVLPSAHPGVALAGTGESGWGVSRGAEGLLAMTRAVHISETSRFIRPPVDPLTGGTARVLSKLTGWLYGGRGSDRAPVPPHQPDLPAAQAEGVETPSLAPTESLAVGPRAAS